MVDNWNILKAVSPFVPGKFIFDQIIGQNAIRQPYFRIILNVIPQERRRWSMKDEVYFWDADKHGSLPQVDTIIFQACPKYPKQQVCYFFAIS